MSKDIQDFEGIQDELPVTVAGRVNPQLEDMYWEDAFAGEAYYCAGLTFEDYAPAYCVGYIGYAQYGGSFDEAEKSLCSNWLRIKGDSRLSYEEALPAIRAAWDRMAMPVAAPVAQPAKSGLGRKLAHMRQRFPSMRLLSPAFAR
ncbi:MAG: hypothetical protein H7255_06350 [Ramlibacter sp.]|nr:hypothetical protein [Ramlibacter sp.]